MTTMFAGTIYLQHDDLLILFSFRFFKSYAIKFLRRQILILMSIWSVPENEQVNTNGVSHPTYVQYVDGTSDQTIYTTNGQM